MQLETLEEQTLLEIAEELGRLAVRLRAIDRLADAIDLETLVERMTSTLTFIRATREQQREEELLSATTSGEPTAASGAEDLGTVRSGPSLADQLRELLGQTG